MVKKPLESKSLWSSFPSKASKLHCTSGSLSLSKKRASKKVATLKHEERRRLWCDGYKKEVMYLKRRSWSSTQHLKSNKLSWSMCIGGSMNQLRFLGCKLNYELGIMVLVVLKCVLKCPKSCLIARVVESSFHLKMLKSLVLWFEDIYHAWMCIKVIDELSTHVIAFMSCLRRLYELSSLCFCH